MSLAYPIVSLSWIGRSLPVDQGKNFGGEPAARGRDNNLDPPFWNGLPLFSRLIELQRESGVRRLDELPP